MRLSFVDANVLLEILFARKLSAQCVQLLSDTSKTYAISALTLHTVWYMAEGYKLSPSNVDDMLAVFTILPLTEEAVELARRRYDGKDFEDCLQAACSEAGNCQEIITIDKHFQEYSHSTLTIILID